MSNLDSKITNAMERIESLYIETDGNCYLSFSGGKDSTVILSIIKMCEDINTIPKNSIPAVFCNTGIELGATVEFVRWVQRNYYGNVQIIRPDKTFDWVIKNKGKPMKSKLKSQYLGKYQRGSRSDSVMVNLLGADDKIVKTKLANKDMHLLHEDFDIKVSDKCCDYLKKKPFEKYNKNNNIKGYIVGERMAEGGAREKKQ